MTKDTINSWKNKIIYQIFPRSFYDANNDGDGDLKGIVEKIDYLSWLGIDAIWLCPIYDTDFIDAGYDVNDYYKIWSKFGTLEDFKLLVKKCKEKNIEIIMDLVLNHTSDKHFWFKKALENPNNQEFNYFIWKKQLNEKEKKAISIFGGSAWQWKEKVKQYYFHLFSKNQVDLNWDNTNTIKAMANVIKFWHKLGVNGFRFDAIKHIDKDFENGINNGFCWGKKCVTFLKELINKSFLNNDNYFIFGESSGISVAEIKKYGGGNNKVVHSFYNFAWWEIGWSKKTGRNGFDKNWDYKNFHHNMAPFQNDINISPDLMTIFLTNHDTSRAISRWGDLNYWKQSAKALAIMQFICKGIICIYQGEEIGMINVEFKNRNDFKDIDALNAFDLLVDKKKIYAEEQLLKYMNINSRDCSRSPMHWNSGINYGFSKNKNTWIKMANDFNNQVNVEFQKKDSESILLFYKKLIELYKSKEYQKIFVDGESDFQLLDNGVFLWKRTNKQKSLIAYINITNQTKKLEASINFEKVIISSYLRKYNKTISKLSPYEAIIVLND